MFTYTCVLLLFITTMSICRADDSALLFSVSSKSVGNDATITITPRLPDNQIARITTLEIVDGATEIPGASIVDGTPLVGNRAVIGGYKLTSQRATFIVVTTIGQQQFEVKQCKNGTQAGVYSVTGNTMTKPEARPPIVWHQVVPQAVCHPHCRLVAPPDTAGGDLFRYRFSANDAIISNPHYRCSGDGCPFADNWAVSLIDQHTVEMQVRSRSLALFVDVSADQVSTAATGELTKVATGVITWGEAFSLLIPMSATAAYISLNGVNYPLDTLIDGSPFKILSSRSIIGSNYNYTLELDDACPL